jgi:hypothetical protein
MSTSNDHKLILRYTKDDNGVWLYCEDCCDYVRNLGFSATPSDAVIQAFDHCDQIAADND